MASTISKQKVTPEERVAALESELARERRAARDQAALYKISALAGSADDMQTFYEGIHGILRDLVYAENIYIALFDEEKQRINFPYAVDSVDKDWPDPREWQALGDKDTKGATGYILRTGRTIRSRAAIERLLETGELEPLGPPPVDFLGVPLRTEGHTIGVLTVQSYVEGRTYSNADEALMVFVADHIAAALERTRSDAELRQRNAELAIVNEVGLALAKQLDLNAVTELVGERLHKTFPEVDMFVAVYDKPTKTLSFPYEIADNKRYHTEPMSAESGLTATVVKTRQPLLIRTKEEAAAHGAIFIGNKVSESWLGVPIQAGHEIIGVLALETDQPYAFDENNLRLVSTLGASTGVALRNARLFDETNRLLAESTQRNAELAVINEIGAALARQLDFQAIVDAVGDRVAQILDTSNLAISVLDEPANLIRFPYTIENGARIEDSPPLVVGEGLTSKVLASRRSLRLGTLAEAEAMGALYQGEVHESYLGVPILSGQRTIGVLALSKHGENAFSEADEQLVSTIASSMGVALENARLFEETNRLLTETEQRNAELAVINEIGAALGKQLDFQAIVDAVGDRLADVLSSRNMYVAILDERTGVISFPYSIENGVRDHMPSLPIGEGLTSRVLTTGRSVRLGTVADAEALGVVWFGDVQASYLGVPIVAGERVIGVLSLSKPEPNAFAEADEQLVSTIASSMGVALENARLFEETNRLLTETEQRASELSIINAIGSALAEQLDFQAIVDLVGDRLVAMFQTRDFYIALLDRTRNLITFPYETSDGQRVHSGPIEFGRGVSSRVIQERRPYRLATRAEQAALGGFESTYAEGNVGPVTESWLGVPILAGREAIGVVVLGDHAPNKYSEQRRAPGKHDRIEHGRRAGERPPLR